MTAVLAADGALSEVGRSARDLGRILRGKPVLLVGMIAAVLSTASCACLLGFLFVPFLAAIVTGTARSVLADDTKDLEWKQLPVAVLPAAIPFGALVFAVAGVRVAGNPGFVAGVGLGAIATGGLLGPIVGVTYHAYSGVSLGGAMTAALADAVRVGAVRRALAGGTIALLTTGVPIAVAASFGREGRPWLWSLACVVLGQSLGALWMLALGRPIESGRTPSDPAATSAMRGVLRLAAPVLALAAITLFLAAIRPSSAHSTPTSAERGRAQPVEGEQRLPGEHGLSVRAEGDSLTIETADGGGAGAVSTGHAPCGPAVPESLPVGTFYAAADGGGWIAFHRSWTACMFEGGRLVELGVRFDERGVRTDDGIVDRVATRLGRSGAGLLVVALCLLAPFVWVFVRGVGSAAMLDRGAGAGHWTSWSGTLEIDSGGELRVRRGVAEAKGARCVRRDAEGIVSLATGARVLGDATELRTGSPVAVVAPRSHLVALGPRSGAVPWPRDGWLVVGSLDSAKERIVRDAVRSAATFGIVAAVAILVACAKVLFSL